LTVATAAGGFAAKRPVDKILIEGCVRLAAGAGAQQQMRVASC